MKRKFEIGLYLGAVLFYSVFILRTRFGLDGKIAFSLFDDAMISLTYARNLAEGHGLRWFPGLPAIEGYTNFLWTLWMALYHWIGISDYWVSFAVQVTGAFFLLGATWFNCRSSKILFPNRPYFHFAVSFLSLFYYPTVFWTLRGMEVGFLAMLISAGMFYCLDYPNGKRFRLMFVLFLLPLVRDDAVIPALVMVIYTSANLPKGSPFSNRFKDVGPLFFCAIVPLVLHMIGRKLYYGEWLPNTYFLKMQGVPLLSRIHQGLYMLYVVFSLNLWPLFFPLFFLGRNAWKLRLPIAITIGQAAYSTWVGGDAWEDMHYSNRYLSIAAPAFLLAYPAAIESFLKRIRERRVQLRMMVGLPVGAGLLLSRYFLSKPGPYPVVLFLGLGFFGLLLFMSMRDTKSSKVEPPSTISVRLTLLLLFCTSQAKPYFRWWVEGASHSKDDARMATMGLALNRCTREDTKIAVTWAGAIPYFSKRQPIDVLGKNDSYISHLPARHRHVGHNKWDLDYSIGGPRPEIVVLQIWPDETSEDVERLTTWGYHPVAWQVYILGVPETAACRNFRWDRI